MAGLVQMEDGRHVAKCLNGLFWLSPACRADASSCIPVLTAGSGGALMVSPPVWEDYTMIKLMKHSCWFCHLFLITSSGRAYSLASPLQSLCCCLGWGHRDIMQWATAYAMPLSLGVAKTFSDEVSMVKDGRFVFYWYEFLDIRGAEKKVCWPENRWK